MYEHQFFFVMRMARYVSVESTSFAITRDFSQDGIFRIICKVIHQCDSFSMASHPADIDKYKCIQMYCQPLLLHVCKRLLDNTKFWSNTMMWCEFLLYAIHAERDIHPSDSLEVHTACKGMSVPYMDMLIRRDQSRDLLSREISVERFYA